MKEKIENLINQVEKQELKGDDNFVKGYIAGRESIINILKEIVKESE